jgi:site-specific recombinase XerD
MHITTAELVRDFSPSSVEPLSLGRSYNQLITCQTDEDAVRLWLENYRDSPRTLDCYRKEGERIYLWTRGLGKRFADLTFEDTIAYRGFLLSPGEGWVSRVKYPRKDPKWRPFTGPLSAASATQALRIVNSLFGWLVEARYLPANPFALRRQTATRNKVRLTRNLTGNQIIEVMKTIESMPEGTERQRMHKVRCKWMFVLLYLTGLRISEAISLKMSDFYARNGGDGKLRWWIHFVGKGNKEANQPVTSELLQYFQEYRVAMGLSMSSTDMDNLPAILRISKKDRERHLDRTSAHAIIKTVFRMTSKRLKELNRSDEVVELENASAHWIRHAMGSNLGSSGASMPSVRDLLRHSSLHTTNVYVHTEDEKLHDELEKLHKMPGPSATHIPRDKELPCPN